ncbi:MAG: hypothetical protein A2928_00115 [Candidatus Taylorbacteria bacterium RIFCSPLOWO2_01_FULL_45_15b]|uniref:Polysaccharide biosynthesis protein C-terminal domain-containing protein n=1 Tax=Candidatus Taylorbacteria bacterium RIFCSPLOWO2_01_FULL_45_15b TaxID=1802319 RepID=A0A1G2N8E3_9BACT|nr:MAG: hypothetical protein A2928_00115 [Candidatus Taylorbacteria bacterium RIFCSPLOWO2_01_FULL_45_15b]
MKPAGFLKTFFYGEAHFSVWGLFSKMLGFLNMALVLSVLSTYEYGVAQLLLVSYSSVSFFMVLGAGSINNELLRSIGSNDLPKAKAIFQRSSILRFTIGIILWAVFFFGGSIIFSHRFTPEFASLIKVVSFFFINDTLSSIIQPLLKGGKKFAIQARRLPLERILYLALLLYFIFVKKDFGISHLLISQVTAAIIANISLVPATLSIYREWRGVRASKVKIVRPILFGIGRWEIIRPFFEKIVGFLQPALIKLFISTEAVAIFSVAKTILSSLGDLMPIRTLSSLLPLHVNDRYMAGKIFIYGTKYLTLLAVLLMVTGLIIVPPVVKIFFPQYVQAIPIFMVLAFNLPIGTLGALPGTYLAVMRRQKFIFIHSMIRTPIILLLYLTLLPAFSLIGLAFERLLTPFIMLTITLVYLRRKGTEIIIPWSRFFAFDDEDRRFIRKIYYGIKMRLRVSS